MSVVLGDALEGGREPSDALARYPDEYLVTLKARFVRSHDQIVARDPVEDEPAHGLVVGDKMHPASRRKRFANAAEWEVRPSEVEPLHGQNRLPSV